MRKTRLFLLALSIFIFAKPTFALLTISAPAENEIYYCPGIEAKILFEEAVATSIRATGIPTECGHEDWLSQAQNNEERLEILRLYVLGVYGSYTDAVLYGLSLIADNYTSFAIMGDLSNIDLARKAVLDFLDILITLDNQIRAYRTYFDIRSEDFEKFYVGGKTFPCQRDQKCWEKYMREASEQLYSEEQTEIQKRAKVLFFIAQNPKYQQLAPGFSSGVVVDMIAHGRTTDSFHNPEIQGLLDLWLELEPLDNLSDDEYYDIIDRIRLLLFE